MKAAIITIGDELLIGQVIDTNSAWIADRLTTLGIEVSYKISVGDHPDAIKEALAHYASKVDLVITTGGLGPTNDDLTYEVMAEYFHMPLAFDEALWNKLVEHYLSRKKTPSESLKKQCWLPEKMQQMNNDLGSAPGLFHVHNKTLFAVLPGVPFEMKHLFDDRLVELIKPYFDRQKIVQRTLLTVGLGESQIADIIKPIETNLPDHIQLAYLPDVYQVRLRLTGKGVDESILGNEIEQISNQIYASLGTSIYGEGKSSIVNTIASLLKSRSWMLGLAESCTGGNISGSIVGLPGVSSFFQGSIISYSNEIKSKILGVESSILDLHGAVSEPTVIRMAEHALKLLDVEIVAAISGILGPDGGSIEKPVGLVYVAVAIKGRDTLTWNYQFNRDRTRNIQYAVMFVLDKIRTVLLNTA